MADNDNPFETPLASEVGEHQQAQAATVQASDNGNPFAEPLLSEKVEAKRATEDPRNAIPTPTLSTNPKLLIASSAKDLPPSAGAALIGAGGLQAGALLSEATAPVLKHIATEWGQPAVKALEDAAASHPVVAKFLAHALADAGVLGFAKYMKLFGK